MIHLNSKFLENTPKREISDNFRSQTEAPTKELKDSFYSVFYWDKNFKLESHFREIRKIRGKILLKLHERSWNKGKFLLTIGLFR